MGWLGVAGLGFLFYGLFYRMMFGPPWQRRLLATTTRLRVIYALVPVLPAAIAATGVHVLLRVGLGLP